jgi:hypothetical protein
MINSTWRKRRPKRKIPLPTVLFFGSIALAASLAFFLLLLGTLRLDSSVSDLINETKTEPSYLWTYFILTILAIVLFGLNAAFFVYRWRKFSLLGFKPLGGSGLGTILSVAASACPVCGSTLLSLIGLSAGLAVFPLAGLELKALSVLLLALPLSFPYRTLPAKACPTPRNPFLKEGEKHWLACFLILVGLFSYLSWGMLKTEPVLAKWLPQKEVGPQNELYSQTMTKVLPEKGIKSRISLQDSVVELIEAGVIDRQKFETLYEQRGGLPQELKEVLGKPADEPILLTQENANYYLNLLWPLGLAQYMEQNKKSPIAGPTLFNFASTGGWTLGKEKNGGAYFNQFTIVALTPEQEELVVRTAEKTFRPCCNNSTFFQDCNHGSALLGLFILGAAQNLAEDELFKEALTFNSFWFPQNYIQTALYFKVVKGTDWENVDPKEVLSKDFSSLSGWQKNVAEKIKDLDLVPTVGGAGGCGI